MRKFISKNQHIMAETTNFSTIFVILFFYLIKIFDFLGEYIAKWNINCIVQHPLWPCRLMRLSPGQLNVSVNDGPAPRKYLQREDVFTFLYFGLGTFMKHKLEPIY